MTIATKPNKYHTKETKFEGLRKMAVEYACETHKDHPILCFLSFKPIVIRHPLPSRKQKKKL